MNHYSSVSIRIQIESIRRQIDEIELQFFDIEERKSKFVSDTDIPLQLIRDGREKERLLNELRAKKEELEMQLAKFGLKVSSQEAIEPPKSEGEGLGNIKDVSILEGGQVKGGTVNIHVGHSQQAKNKKE